MENKLTKEQRERLEKFKAMREQKAEEQREKFKSWIEKVKEANKK